MLRKEGLLEEVFILINERDIEESLKYKYHKKEEFDVFSDANKIKKLTSRESMIITEAV